MVHLAKPGKKKGGIVPTKHKLQCDLMYKYQLIIY